MPGDLRDRPRPGLGGARGTSDDETLSKKEALTLVGVDESQSLTSIGSSEAKIVDRGQSGGQKEGKAKSRG